MKIVCIASSAIGHIDFGGGGYLRLAEALCKDGCDVHWLSFGEQVERLKAKTGGADAAPEIANLALRPFFPEDKIAQFENAHRGRINALRRLCDRLRQLAPDFILFDRLLAYGGLVAERIATPYAAVGTPGGYWRMEEAGAAINVHAVPGPVADYVVYSKRLKDDLDWPSGVVDSAWLRSPQLNICFMPRAFYPGAQDSTGAFVHHHTPAPADNGASRLAVSFGNQGAHGSLRTFLQRVVAKKLAPFPIDAYAGSNDALAEALNAEFNAQEVNVHGWVDFADHLKSVGCMAFLGGVGTIWRCLNNRVPMVILPGLIGDQLENAQRVASLEIGFSLEENEDPREAIASCFSDAALAARIDGLRSVNAYSHTMESVCRRIRACAAS